MSQSAPPPPAATATAALHAVVEALAHALNNPVHTMSLSLPVLRGILADIDPPSGALPSRLGGLPACEALAAGQALITESERASSRIAATVALLRRYLGRGAFAAHQVVTCDAAIGRIAALIGVDWPDVAVTRADASPLTDAPLAGAPHAVQALIHDLIEGALVTRQAPRVLRWQLTSTADGTLELSVEAPGPPVDLPPRRGLHDALRDLVATQLGARCSPIASDAERATGHLTLAAAAP